MTDFVDRPSRQTSDLAKVEAEGDGRRRMRLPSVSNGVGVTLSKPCVGCAFGEKLADRISAVSRHELSSLDDVVPHDDFLREPRVAGVAEPRRGQIAERVDPPIDVVESSQELAVGRPVVGVERIVLLGKSFPDLLTERTDRVDARLAAEIQELARGSE